MPIITENLIKSYGKRTVVDKINLKVEKGEIVGLLGPNGAGKTTTFYMVVGLISPNNGSVYLNGEDITTLPMHKRALKGLGYLPQDPSVFRKLTVEENIFIIWELINTLPQEQWSARLDELLQELKISHLRNHKGYHLSGGEARRVEIARALATNPDFLLLDEPFTGIDPITVTDIQEIIANLKTKGLGVLITDHNVRETLRITDRTYIVHKGKILISGSPDEIANDPAARELYLGEKFNM